VISSQAEGFVSNEDLLSVIDPEKVRIQHCLHDPSKNSDLVKVAFGEVSVYPIGDVQCSVDAQREQIVRSYSLCLSSALQQEELRQDCHRLQPNAERPQYLGWCVFVREDDCKYCRPAEQVANFEGVEVGVMGRLIVVKHQVQGICAG